MIVLLWPRQECSQKWFKDLYHVCKQRKIINICTDYNFLIRNVLVFNRRWILNSGIFLIKNLKCQNSYMSELVLELQLAFSVIIEGQQTWLLNGWFIIVNPMTTFDDTAGFQNFQNSWKFLYFPWKCLHCLQRRLSCASQIVTGRHKTCDNVMLF